MWSAWTPWRTSSRPWTTRCRTIPGTTTSRRRLWLQALIAKGALGQKTGAGFYKKAGKDIVVLDLGQGRLRVSERQGRDEVAAILKRSRILAEKFAKLRASDRSAGAVPVGDPSATCSITPLITWPISPTPRAMSTSPSAGATAGSSVRSKPGRPPAGSRSPSGFTEDIAAGKAMSKAPLPAWVTDGRTGVARQERLVLGQRQRGQAAFAAPGLQASAVSRSVLGEKFDQGTTFGRTTACACGRLATTASASSRSRPR